MNLKTPFRSAKIDGIIHGGTVLLQILIVACVVPFLLFFSLLTTAQRIILIIRRHLSVFSVRESGGASVIAKPWKNFPRGLTYEVLLWGLGLLLTMGALGINAHGAENLKVEFVNRTNHSLIFRTEVDGLAVRHSGASNADRGLVIIEAKKKSVLMSTKSNGHHLFSTLGKTSIANEVYRENVLELPIELLIKRVPKLHFGVRYKNVEGGEVEQLTNEKFIQVALFRHKNGKVYWPHSSKEETEVSLMAKRNELAQVLRLSFKLLTNGSTIHYFLEEYDLSQGFKSELLVHAMNYNVFLRPIAILNDGQLERPKLIGEYFNSLGDAAPDVIAFNEAFDDDSRYLLRKELRTLYPFQSSHAGKDRGVFQDSGVFIVSRFPIVEEDEVTFGQLCNRDMEDCLADKGIKYVKIYKDGHFVHVFGTHLQNGNTLADEKVKLVQVKMMVDFAKRKNLGAEDKVIVLGDLNIKIPDRAKELDDLGVFGQREFSGGESYNPDTNKLAAGGPKETVDVATVFTFTKFPKQLKSVVTSPKSPTPWRRVGRTTWYHDLSDHYPMASYFTF